MRREILSAPRPGSADRMPLETVVMCRSIQTLFNYDPPTTEEEIFASSLQYVRKVSGFRKPSKANEAVFETAVEEISAATKRLLESLISTAPPRNRAEEIARARAKALERFGRAPEGSG